MSKTKSHLKLPGFGVVTHEQTARTMQNMYYYYCIKKWYSGALSLSKDDLTKVVPGRIRGVGLGEAWRVSGPMLMARSFILSLADISNTYEQVMVILMVMIILLTCQALLLMFYMS